MKIELIILNIILLAALPVFSAEDMFSSPESLEKLDEIFYEAPFMGQPDVNVVDPKNSDEKPSNVMPLFKKYRIKMTNYFRMRDLKNAEKTLEKEKLEHSKLKYQEEIYNDYADKVLDTEQEKTENEVQVQEEKPENTLELQGAVKENINYNEVVLDADNVDYNDETNDIIATGNPVLVFPQYNITLKADKMVYNNLSNILKAYDNVTIYKDGDTIYGDFLQVNMNEENSLLDNVSAKKEYLTVKARKATSEADKIILYDGNMVSEESNILNFHTQMIGGNNFNEMLVDEDGKSSMAEYIGDTAVKIQAKDIYVNAKKEHDVITLKDATINYGSHELFTIPSFTFHTNKKQEYFEANYPEFGSRTKLGMFLGPGFVFDIPNGAIIKAIPFINNKDKIGFGGALKYKSGTNQTDFAYGSSADVFILRGRQKLDDKLELQYGVNSYLSDWWFGMRMPKYGVDLVYRDKAHIDNTLRKGLGLDFEHRASFGYMQDNDLNRYGENIPLGNIGTTRTRYMAQATQSFYDFTDKKNLIRANVALVMQGSAALYGTGDTQIIGRIGPRLMTQYKNWMQDITYYLSAYEDNTPMPVYDAYRYGHSNMYIREALRLNKWLTVAWSGSMNMSDDSYNGKLFQENSFILAFGPDDIKVSIGYDFVREQTYFGIYVLMDTKGSSLEYEKMEIKNPDKLAKNNRKEPKLIDYYGFEEEEEKPAQEKIYAEVIDIEDPDREQI